MRLSTIFSLLITCSFLTTSPGFAMLAEEEKGTTIPKQLTFEEQLEKAEKFVGERTSNALPVKMVFGATNKECDRITDEAYIFLDTMDHDPNGRTHVKADFNDLNKMGKIAAAIGPHLTELSVDDSTYKFTEWTTSHLRLFTSMLKDDGKFIFCPCVQFAPVQSQYTPSSDEEITEALRAINLFDSEKLPNGYRLPWTNPSAADLDLPEVLEVFQKYEPLDQFKGLTERECNTKLKELGFRIFYPPRVLQDPQELKRQIAKGFKDRIVRERAEREFYLPNIQKVLEAYFEDVRLEENVPFPFPSRYNKMVSFMIYAKNPKRD